MNNKIRLKKKYKGYTLNSKHFYQYRAAQLYPSTRHNLGKKVQKNLASHPNSPEKKKRTKTLAKLKIFPTNTNLLSFLYQIKPQIHSTLPPQKRKKKIEKKRKGKKNENCKKTRPSSLKLITHTHTHTNIYKRRRLKLKPILSGPPSHFL